MPGIRPVSRDDLEAVLVINRSSTPGVAPLEPPYFDTLIRECRLFRVVEIQKVVVGYVCAMDRSADYDGEEFAWFRTHADEAFLYIDQLAISPAFRRMGLARFLYDTVADYAREHGIFSLACEVSVEPLNLASHRFHYRYGFREVGRLLTRGVGVALMIARPGAIR